MVDGPRGGAAAPPGYDPRLLARKRKPRQEISACLKWLCFVLNFIAFLIGLTILSLGVYLCVKDPRGVSDWADILLNPAIMLAIIGFILCVVAMAGALGALRDNVHLLKTFAMCTFFCYIVMVVCTFLLFILFYSDTTDGLSAHSVITYGIKRYHSNRNIADLVDYLQEQLECCGVSSVSAGFRDWNLSPQFNCSDANPYPERCGVPFSCCRRSVMSEAAGSANPLLPAMRSLECWQNALSKRPQDIEVDIHTRGCLFPLRTVFESHALHIGMVVAVFIIPVCVSVCLSNVLARQIDHQRWLLEREARRNDKRRKRERYRLEKHHGYNGSTSALRQMEAGTLAENIKKEATPKLPDTPPPDKPPVEYTSRKKMLFSAPPHRRAASSSPSRKRPSARPNGGPIQNYSPPHKNMPSAPSAHSAAKSSDKEKRQRSVPAHAALSSESQGRSSGEPPGRTHRWILQQSDLVNPRPKS